MCAAKRCVVHPITTDETVGHVDTKNELTLFFVPQWQFQSLMSNAAATSTRMVTMIVTALHYILHVVAYSTVFFLFDHCTFMTFFMHIVLGNEHLYCCSYVTALG